MGHYQSTIVRSHCDLLVLIANLANSTYPAEFIFQNLTMEANVIESARKARVDRLLFLGSRCIYPKFAPRSLQEDSLLTGTLEPTNRRYAFDQNRQNRDVNRQLSAILTVQDQATTTI